MKALAESYDVIIVGAGNGGLVAACTLSQMGFRTLLLEKHNLPGGCAASFVRGRFEFEASLHNLPYVGPGAENGDIGMLFKRFGVERKFYPIPESLHFIVDGPEPFEFLPKRRRRSAPARRRPSGASLKCATSSTALLRRSPQPAGSPIRP